MLADCLTFALFLVFVLVNTKNVDLVLFLALLRFLKTILISRFWKAFYKGLYKSL